jgi:hypothetical protein
MRESAALSVAVCALLLTACATDHSPKATTYARQACRHRPALPDAASSPLYEVGMRETLHEYQTSASLAAKAANLDARWNELKSAYSTLVDAWSFAVSLPSNPSEVNDFERAQLRLLATKGIAAEATVRTECRKTE